MATRPGLPASLTYAGPTLAANPAIVPDPQPVCTICPLGAWYIADAKPYCFCAAYRTEMYGARHGIVSACDEYEAAIKKRAEELGGD